MGGIEMRKQDAIRKMRTMLLRRREAIRQSLALTREQLHSANERAVGDSVDAAVDAEHHEISSQLAEVESAELKQIDLALERMASGAYGTCEACGRNIPLARLQALPDAALCVNCQHRHESALRRHGSAAFVGESSDLMLNGNGLEVL